MTPCGTLLPEELLQLHQRFIQTLRLLEHAGEEVAFFREPCGRVGDREMVRVEPMPRGEAPPVALSVPGSSPTL